MKTVWFLLFLIFALQVFVLETAFGATPAKGNGLLKAGIAKALTSTKTTAISKKTPTKTPLKTIGVAIPQTTPLTLAKVERNDNFLGFSNTATWDSVKIFGTNTMKINKITTSFNTKTASFDVKLPTLRLMFHFDGTGSVSGVSFGGTGSFDGNFTDVAGVFSGSGDIVTVNGGQHLQFTSLDCQSLTIPSGVFSLVPDPPASLAMSTIASFITSNSGSVISLTSPVAQDLLKQFLLSFFNQILATIAVP